MNGDDKGQQTDQQAGWVFKPGGADHAAQQAHKDTAGSTASSGEKDSVEWTASEYVVHEKHAGWYLQVMLATIIIAALVYLITRDIISTGVVVFAGLVFAVAAARKPRVIAYRIDPGGLTVGQKYYPFSQFKSFAVMEEGALTTVAFIPLKRFLPTVDIYIPPDNAESILNVLSNSLPLETRKTGLVDTLTHRIRF